MSKRSSVVEGKLAPKRVLEERPRDQPELRSKIEWLSEVVENAGGDVEKASEAERRVTEELRKMGNEALYSWARRQAEKKEDKFANKPGVGRKVKKTSIGTRGTEKSKTLEVCWLSAFSAQTGTGTNTGHRRTGRRPETESHF